MRTQFHNRAEAGAWLAKKLSEFAGLTNAIVLGLPRGGVPVAAEVAAQLDLPLDVFVVRKLGLPGYPELAMGAIASGGVRVLNRDVVDSLHVSVEIIDHVAAAEARELERRERAYRDDLPPPEVRGKVVILVDDGIATGSSMMAAVAALRQMGAARIVVAAPVIAPTTLERLRAATDDVVAVFVPPDFQGVGQYYEDFSQTTDEEVRVLLARRQHPTPTA